jgi:hypothetical protein
MNVIRSEEEEERVGGERKAVDRTRYDSATI